MRPPIDILRALGRLIGNTPMLAIDVAFRGRRLRVFAKSEQLNLTGSIKDRMALFILRAAHAEGRIHPGNRIVEATSGNTGISFAAIGRALGHPVTILMPDWMSRERRDLIQSVGGEVIGVSREQGGFVGAIRMAEAQAAADPRVFLPRQFANELNVATHEATTGVEIWSQLATVGLTPAAFVAGVGTGGTVMGVGRCLRGRAPAVRVHPVEPAESPTLSVGHCVGRHRIQGISDEFVPPIVRLDELDAIVRVHDGDAILMAQKLARQLGLGVGVSSGANFVGALSVLDGLDDNAVVVTVFPDDNKKYLTTDLLKEEPEADGYLTPDVDLLGFSSVSRVCVACDAFDTCRVVPAG